MADKKLMPDENQGTPLTTGWRKFGCNVQTNTNLTRKIRCWKWIPPILYMVFLGWRLYENVLMNEKDLVLLLCCSGMILATPGLAVGFYLILAILSILFCSHATSLIAIAGLSIAISTALATRMMSRSFQGASHE